MKIERCLGFTILMRYWTIHDSWLAEMSPAAAFLTQSELIMTAAVCFPAPYAICAPFLWLLQLNGFMFSNATLLDGDTYCTKKSSHPLAASAREILEDIRENYRILGQLKQRCCFKWPMIAALRFKLYSRKRLSAIPWLTPRRAAICGKLNRRSGRHSSCSLRTFNLGLHTVQ